jgi:hypothetical protein
MLGDPAAVGTSVDFFHRQRYYKELDRQATSLMNKTKQWDGAKYIKVIKCASLLWLVCVCVCVCVCVL